MGEGLDWGGREEKEEEEGERGREGEGERGREGEKGGGVDRCN